MSMLTSAGTLATYNTMFKPTPNAHERQPANTVHVCDTIDSHVVDI
jgi:hypothetical protein